MLKYLKYQRKKNCAVEKKISLIFFCVFFLLDVIGYFPLFLGSSRAIVIGSWAWPGARFMVKVSHRETSLIGMSEVFCTAGFPATDDKNDLLFLTSGHCGQKGDRIYSIQESQPIEDVGEIIYSSKINQHAEGNIDVAVVKINKGKRLIGTNHHIEYSGVTTAPIGSILCLVDDLTGVSCGSVLSDDHPEQTAIRRHDQDLHISYLVQETFLCSTQGDSGGPIYSPNGAAGIATADTPEGKNCANYPLIQIFHSDETADKQFHQGVRTLITPISDALKLAGLSVKGLHLL